jgi:CBS domain-containing protein
MNDLPEVIVERIWQTVGDTGAIREVGTEMNKTKVDDVMTHLVATLRPEDTIEDAGRLLVSNRISGAPVVREGKLVGLVSEADLVRAFALPHGAFPFEAIDPLTFQLQGEPSRVIPDARVGDVMSRDVISISKDASVWEAASLLDRHGYGRLPVVDGEGYVTGILARSDLVRAMARWDPDLIASVRNAVGLLGLENFSGLEIACNGGRVVIGGTADRKSRCALAIEIAALVPGVVGVSDKLGWRWDDTEVTRVGEQAEPQGLRSELTAASLGNVASH